MLVGALVASLLVVAIACAAALAIIIRLRAIAHRLAASGARESVALDHARALLAVAEAVNSSLALEEVIDEALKWAVQIARARAGAVYLIRDGRVELSREASLHVVARAHGGTRRTEQEPFASALDAAEPTIIEIPPREAPGLERGGHGTRAILVPIRRAGHLVGSLELYLNAGQSADRALNDLLLGIAAQAGTAIKHAQVFREQEASSLTDELTRLPNRRYLGQRFLQERQRARRNKRSLGVLMLDLDHFKIVNDTHGHLVGDTVLAQIGSVLRETVRDSDVCARYGGEEFAVIAHETSLDGAMRLAGRIRSAVEAAPFPNGLRLTVSIGVAATEDPERFGDLFEMADGALYQAKRAGRNRVVPHLEPTVA